MTATKRGTPSADDIASATSNTKGAEASNQLVDVYKILAKAGGPLTAPEIAQQMPSSYRAGASRKYKEFKEKEDPSWLEGRANQWGSVAIAAAMTWYVREVVQFGIKKKNISVVSRSQMSGRTGRREGTYTIGSKPPMVNRTKWVEVTKQVPWSQEDETALAQGQVASMQFLQKLPEYLRQGKHTVAETKEMLDLAERAIRKENRD